MCNLRYLCKEYLLGKIWSLIKSGRPICAIKPYLYLCGARSELSQSTTWAYSPPRRTQKLEAFQLREGIDSLLATWKYAPKMYLHSHTWKYWHHKWKAFESREVVDSLLLVIYVDGRKEVEHASSQYCEDNKEYFYVIFFDKSVVGGGETIWKDHFWKDTKTWFKVPSSRWIPLVISKAFY